MTMFRAMIMWLASPVYEVRLINMKSGKDIPGTRLCKGTYRKCLKVFRAKRIKYGECIRLQAVAVLDHRINDNTMEKMVEIPPGMIVVDEASVIPDKIWSDGDLADLKDRQQNPDETHAEWLRRTSAMLRDGLKPIVAGQPVHNEITEEGEVVIVPGTIADSNARQSEFMHKHQDEPNEYRGEDLDDHLCDTDGPQDWDMEISMYAPTCSICGNMRSTPSPNPPALPG